MKKRGLSKDNLLNIIAILLILIVINQLLVSFFIVKDFRYAFWFSDHVAFILAIGIIMRKRIIVTGELCIALIPETIWTLDFLSKLIFNKYLFAVVGIANYLFEKGILVTRWQNLSTLQHLFILPLGITALWIMKADKKGWKFSLLHGSILWLASFLIGPKYNINCAFKVCSPYFENISNYMIVWPIVCFCLIMISNLLIQKIFKPKGKRNQD